MSGLADAPLHAFVDLTADRAPEQAATHGVMGWPHRDHFTAAACRVTCVADPGSTELVSAAARALDWSLIPTDAPVRACNAAMMRAAADQAWFLLLSGPVDASEEALFAMRRCLERDPLFGCAAARIRCADGCCFRRPSRSGQSAGYWIPRRTLAETEDVEVSPELFEASLLFPPHLVAEFGPLDSRFSSIAGAILHYLSKARRCGYRTVIANRALMGISGASCRERGRTPVPDTDQTLLKQLTPDLSRGWEQFRGASNERFEVLSGHAHRTAAVGRPSVLLDIRNVMAVHNGTSRAVLGCVGALHRLSPSWDVTVLAHPAALQFHDVRKMCRGWELTTTPPASPFGVALRLSQPWHIREMVDLHRAALANVYFMLDTISWDVIYPSPQWLDGTWSFLAEHADGFLFDSAFTEKRFLARFPRASDTPRAVCYYPFHPADYVDQRAKRGTDYILVVGNELDHKDAARTLNLLAAAFPFQRFVSLGPPLGELSNLRAHRAGSLSEEDMNQLYAGARYVVFPSFYEGFGFPIVTALAYGKTLIARRSELLDEIAGRCSTGRVIEFARREDLVDIIGRLLHGELIQEERAQPPKPAGLRRWHDVARDIAGFVDSAAAQSSRSRWRMRERAIDQLLAFGS
jgi:glycosyltransferase involved in cell wall biosynthesis